MVLLLITMPMIIVLMISMTESLRQGEGMVVIYSSVKNCLGFAGVSCILLMNG